MKNMNWLTFGLTRGGCGLGLKFIMGLKEYGASFFDVARN